jgi:adenine-specific DNA-methyltransferase
MRDYIIENQNLTYVEDYGHYQLFENATTYVAITLFNKEKNDKVEYVTMERTNDDDGFWEGKIDVPYEDMCIGGKFYFSCKTMLDKMREITEYGKSLKKEDKAFEVKNGFATLADDVFIREDMNEVHKVYHTLNPWNLIPVIKSSTGKQAWCYYPYNEEGKLLEPLRIDPVIFNTLLEHKEKLLSRSTTEPWYAFGRTQAINDTYKHKIAVSNLVRNIYDVKLVEAGPGTGVYGGLYILPKQPKPDTMNFIVNQLQNPEFITYVKLLGKYKSGGYYTFSSKELENYLNWKYGKEKN